jgi:hypothetical protein
MTYLLLALVAMLPLLLVMTLDSSPAADAAEERARKSLRRALGDLVSSGVSATRASRLAADELDELCLLVRGTR